MLDPKLQDEMVGVLTAISIVSKKLARKLLELDENKAMDGMSAEDEVNLKNLRR